MQTPHMQTALRHYQSMFGSHGFNREALPDPESYFAEQLGKLRGRGAWRLALCCFHDESNPSLSLNVETGGFRCHACNAHGGDVLDFHRQRYGMGFKEAAQALGAWEGR